MSRPLHARAPTVPLLAALVACVLSLATQADEPPAELTDGLGLKLRLIPSGEFLMGCDEPEAQLEGIFGKQDTGFTSRDERPLHPVRITRNFYIGVYEVSLSQFRAFADAAHYSSQLEQAKQGAWGWNNTLRTDEKRREFGWRYWGVSQSDTSPVTNVTWHDAQEFCAWISEQEHATYRLPTEAEWEYACRAGTSTRFYDGSSPEDVHALANLADLTSRDVRNRRSRIAIDGVPRNIESRYPNIYDGFGFTAPAGRFRPNLFGLYDMLGNASEWTADWYAADYYSRSPRDNPPGPASGTERVLRGANFNSYAFDARCSTRRKLDPRRSYHLIGFRVVREAP